MTLYHLMIDPCSVYDWHEFEEKMLKDQLGLKLKPVDML